VDEQIRVRINKDGRIVIPASIRQALDIHPEEELVLRVENHELQVVTLKSCIERAQDRIRQYVNPNRSLADELISERREAARSDREL